MPTPSPLSSPSPPRTLLTADEQRRHHARRARSLWRSLSELIPVDFGALTRCRDHTEQAHELVEQATQALRRSHEREADLRLDLAAAERTVADYHARLAEPARDVGERCETCEAASEQAASRLQAADPWNDPDPIECSNEDCFEGYVLPRMEG